MWYFFVLVFVFFFFCELNSKLHNIFVSLMSWIRERETKNNTLHASTCCSRVRDHRTFEGFYFIKMMHQAIEGSLQYFQSILFRSYSTNVFFFFFFIFDFIQKKTTTRKKKTKTKIDKVLSSIQELNCSIYRAHTSSLKLFALNFFFFFCDHFFNCCSFKMNN